VGLAELLADFAVRSCKTGSAAQLATPPDLVRPELTR
jgi:hypothetical protein